MILTSTSTSVPFTPPWFCHEDGTPHDGAPVYMLRSAGVIERGQMEAEISGPHRAGKVLGFELRQTMQAGVMVLLADDPELDTVLAAIAAEAEAEMGSGEVDDSTARLLKQVRGVMTEHWPEYRDLIAQLDRRRQIAPIVALRRYCTGWSNVVDVRGEPVEFVRGPDGTVAEAALSRLPEFDMLFAGNRAYSLQYGWGEEKNSPRPGSSAKDPETSPSVDTSKAGGKSTASGGKKIRAPRSPRGSGR